MDAIPTHLSGFRGSTVTGDYVSHPRYSLDPQVDQENRYSRPRASQPSSWQNSQQAGPDAPGVRRPITCGHLLSCGATTPQPQPSSVPWGPDPSPRQHLKHEPLTTEPKKAPHSTAESKNHQYKSKMGQVR